MCDHSYHKSATYLSAFGAGRDIYMCQCGALLDAASAENQSMTPEEVNALVTATVQKRVADKVEMMKAKILKALEEMEGA